MATLREQKKRETYLRIQDEAFRLAGGTGYAATTVDDIAAAARVSASTVYRYFGTKEGIFLWDELELPAVELLEKELVQRAPLEAVLGVLGSLGEMGFHISEDEMRRRVQFLYAEPALRAALHEGYEGFERRLTDLFVEAGTGERQAARILAGITMTVVAAAIETWAFDQPQTSLPLAFEQTMASLGEVLAR